MMKRAQIAYHFQFNPAQQTPGAVRLPDTITRTVSVGDELVTEKVSSVCLLSADRTALVAEIEKQVAEATRTARPKGADTAPAAGPETEEESAF